MILLKHCKDLLLTPITPIVKQMYISGIFPERFKIAKVKPLHKKDGESILVIIGLFFITSFFKNI